MRLMKLGLACVALMVSAGQLPAAVLYSNGFETDNAGWNVFGGSLDATRESSGTNGVPSASGLFHALNSSTGSATKWGGYNFGAGSVPTSFQEYTTSIDIYLNVNADAPWANDTRFDFDSAVGNSTGGFLRDFIFNAGFYNNTDNTGPGAGTNRFVISASNNSQTPAGGQFAKNPGRDPIAISTTGWYTFQQHFYDNAGVLAVDLSIFDASHTLIHTWTLSDPADLIAGVGGNRYGWFDVDQFGDTLAFDNTSLTTAAAVPEPASLAVWGLAAVGMLIGVRRRNRNEAS